MPYPVEQECLGQRLQMSATKKNSIVFYRKLSDESIREAI
jgi:hypothetical protein